MRRSGPSRPLDGKRPPGRLWPPTCTGLWQQLRLAAAPQKADTPIVPFVSSEICASTTSFSRIVFIAQSDLSKIVFFGRYLN